MASVAHTTGYFKGSLVDEDTPIEYPLLGY